LLDFLCELYYDARIHEHQIVTHSSELIHCTCPTTRQFILTNRTVFHND